MNTVRFDPQGPFRRDPIAPHQMRDRLTRTQDTFLQCHLGVPRLERDRWSLTIDGMVERRELIVNIDDKTCRHSWSAHGAPLTHHNASVQVFAEGQEKCRVVWIADLMPNEIAAAIGEMIQQALNAMKQTLESSRAGV